MKKILAYLLLMLSFSTLYALELVVVPLSGINDTLEFEQDMSFYFSDPNAEVTQLVQPKNAAVNVSVSPLFVWRLVEGKSYELLLSQSESFSDTLFHVSGLDTNAFRYQGSLLQSSKYYWKVRLSGEESWTLPRYFKTYAPPVPRKIESWAVQGNNSGIELIIQDEMIVDSFMVLLFTDALDLYDTLYIDSSYASLDELQENAYFIKVAGMNSSGTSPLSEMLFATISNDAQTVLIVQGFERQTTGNDGDHILRHAQALNRLAMSVASATNDAINCNFKVLPDWEMIDYILGEESTVDETISTSEIALFKDYLQKGGKLFVSGAELAWDLDHKGTSAEKAFCHDFLHLAYYQDAPGGQSSTNYHVRGIGDTVFSALGNFSFDNGTHGSYNVKYADVFTPKNGAQKVFEYPGFAGAAGVVYEGYFPEGLESGKIMVLGFPFETVYPESKRLELMHSFVEFSQHGLAVLKNDIPVEHKLLPNYPNPFNPKTAITYQLSAISDVEIIVYDMNGRKVSSLVNRSQIAGSYRVIWDASHLSSGIYFTVMKVDGKIIETQKLTLMK